MLALANLFEHTKSYLEKALQTPSLATMTSQQAREMRAKLPKTAGTLAALAKIEEITIPARDGYQMAVRIYTPIGEGPFNIIIYYHGGGWVLNDLNTCHESCSYLANRTNHIVVSVEYRLAPEYKFPIPVHDAYDAFLWTRAHAAQFNGNAQNISVAGDSAGGNLAIAVCQLAAAAPEQLPIQAQILLYPVTDLSFNSNSYKLFEKGFGLDLDVMQWFGKYYVSEQQDAKNPLVAPLQLTNFSQFPPTLIFAAENDVLRDEALHFANNLTAHHVPTTAIVMEGIVHSYFTHNEVFQVEIEQTIQQIAAFLNDSMGDSLANC